MRADVAGTGRAAFARDFDVCVIGAGPAGITLARSLAAQGFDVALMEAGGLDWSPESQDVYLGENTGHAYFGLDETRLRFFGGTSYHWNGVCREIDAEDFAGRPQNPGSGWPIGRADLDPYAAGAHAILELTPDAFPDLPRPEGAAFRQIRFFSSPPVRFGEKYLDEITAAPRIFLGLNANLVDLRLGPGLDRVTGAVFRSYAPGDPGFTVRARAYCLCAGGIENPRLLLNFRSQTPEGLGNRHDLVGRYFTEHPQMELGEALFEDPGLIADLAYFAPTEAFLAAAGTLPLSLRVKVRAQRELSLVTEAVREAQCALPFGERLAAAVTGGSPGRCDTGGLRAWRRSLDPARYPFATIDTNSEQALNPDSRVTLAATRDAFGLRRPRLHWAPQAFDFRTIQLGTLAFARYFAEAGLGRVRVRDRLLEGPETLPGFDEDVGHVASWHHMCTTRMSDDPRAGVVDRDCRVHGIANLHVGGSSVFASGSFVNPTYTIVQLALRLGDHLGATLRA